MCVHYAPAEFEEIKQWIDELDLGLKYTGQGLPAISAQVLLLLVKRGKSGEYPTDHRVAVCLEAPPIKSQCIKNDAKQLELMTADQHERKHKTL